MERRPKSGQILLIIAVILLVIVAFTLLAAQFVATRPSPIVDEASWRVDGLKVSSVLVRSGVEARVVVKAVGEYEGSIVVKVRKDIALWFDRDYAISTTPVSLVDGQKVEIKLYFIPDEASGGSLRGYFIEVEFSATKTTWTMENAYPPRLTVLPSITD